MICVEICACQQKEKLQKGRLRELGFVQLRQFPNSEKNGSIAKRVQRCRNVSLHFIVSHSVGAEDCESLELCLSIVKHLNCLHVRVVSVFLCN